MTGGNSPVIPPVYWLPGADESTSKGMLCIIYIIPTGPHTCATKYPSIILTGMDYVHLRALYKRV